MSERAPVFKKIYLSPLFMISLVLVVINSLSMASTLTSQALAELSRFGAEKLAFQTVSVALLREVIPVSTGLILALLAVIHCQYRVKNKSPDFLSSVYANLIWVLSLIAIGLVVSITFAYVEFASLPINANLSFSDLALPILKGTAFSFSLYMLRRVHVKIVQVESTLMFSLFVCFALVVVSSASILFFDYGATRLFAGS
jgi:hypothetical protein